MLHPHSCHPSGCCVACTAFARLPPPGPASRLASGRGSDGRGPTSSSRYSLASQLTCPHAPPPPPMQTAPSSPHSHQSPHLSHQPPLLAPLSPSLDLPPATQPGLLSLFSKCLHPQFLLPGSPSPGSSTQPLSAGGENAHSFQG